MISEWKEREEENCKSFIIFTEQDEGEKKAILERTTSISYSLIDNLCDHKE
jgi:hypothetical protein